MFHIKDSWQLDKPELFKKMLRSYTCMLKQLFMNIVKIGIFLQHCSIHKVQHLYAYF